MSNWEIIGVIASVITIVGGMVIHLVHTVWWMSQLKSSLDALKETVREIKDTLVKHETMFVTTKEYYKDQERIEGSLKANWNKMEDIRNKLDDLKKQTTKGEL